MKKKILRSVIVRKFKATTDSNHDYRVFDNKLAQNFNVSDYNRAWVSDITYIKTWQGWQYLTTVIDLCNRKVIGFQIINTLRSEDTVIPALNKACSNSPIKKGQPLIFHSDRGVQYACNRFKETIKSYKYIEESMSAKEDCYDNAVAESFFKTSKAELIYQNTYKTKKQTYMSVFQYIEGFYNTN